MMTPPVLYSFRRCPYAMRARMALLVSETPFELREVKLSAKPSQMLAASPKGTVPVLVLADGRVIDESLEIMDWALRRDDPEDWLSAQDRSLIAVNDGPFKFHLDRYKYPERHDSDPYEHRGAALELLTPLEARLDRHRYLCGPARSFSDGAIFPFIRQFAATDRPWFDSQPVPALRKWLDDHLALPLFARTMERNEVWQS